MTGFPLRASLGGNDKGLMTMTERTPSQTVGPFLHVGLDAGAVRAPGSILDRPSPTPGQPGNAHPHRGPGVRWRGHADARCAGRDLAGRQRRAATRIRQMDGRLPPIPSAASGAARRPRTAASSSPPSFRAGRRTGWDDAGAAHQRRRVLARHVLKRLFTRIYFAGDAGEREATRSWRWCRPLAARR